MVSRFTREVHDGHPPPLGMRTGMTCTTTYDTSGEHDDTGESSSVFEDLGPTTYSPKWNLSR